jgi:8-amino-3,8-dideoxy-alpha-D-manno-octulosonate transaminase
MPGFEIFGDEEKKQVADVLETGVLFRYGFEGVRNGHFKALEFEKKLCEITGARYSHLCSSGTASMSVPFLFSQKLMRPCVLILTSLKM